MQQTIDLIWWITAVELPVLAGLAFWVWRNQRHQEAALARQTREFQAMHSRMQIDLASYKQTAQRTYAAQAALRDVERRLTQHLLRIEEKLDPDFSTVTAPKPKNPAPKNKPDDEET